MELLRQAHFRTLTVEDITNLNNRVITMLKVNNLFNNIVFVQCNKMRHLINCLQIERYSRSISNDIIIFLALYIYTKKVSGKEILHKDFFSLQDGELEAIDPDLLYYYKEIPVILLTNICTALEMVNNACSIVYGMII